MITLILTLMVLSFFIGKYSERHEWNKLIKSGKIPKPKKSNDDYMGHYGC